MARPPQDPQIRITEILDAAEPLFYAKGYHETSISDIVKKMNVAQGTIYYYFKSKEEILEALINRYFSTFMAEIRMRIHSGDLSPSQKLQVVIQTLLRTLYRKDELLFEFLFNDRVNFMDKMCRQGRRLTTPVLLEIFEEGNRQRCFNAPYPQVVVNVVIAIIECLIYAVYEKLSPELLAYQLKLAEDLIARALGAEEGAIKIVINK